MIDLEKIYNEYMALTGQSEQYINSGACQYGPGAIDALVEQCLRENKKIVWKTDLIDGRDVGLTDYELRPISRQPKRAKKNNENSNKKPLS